MTEPTAYSVALYKQARDIVDRLYSSAQELHEQPLHPEKSGAMLLAEGPVATEIAAGTQCCVDDQLALAVMVAAELLMRGTPCLQHHTVL